jgi:hypothetical protein
MRSESLPISARQGRVGFCTATLLQYVRIRLTRKLANVINDVDLQSFSVGEEIDLPERAAQMLIYEGWAELSTVIATADDRPSRMPRRSTRERLHELLATPPGRPARKNRN